MEELDHGKSRFNYRMGVVEFVVMLFVTWLLWYLLLNPNGIVKLYRLPPYGLSLVTVFFSIVVMMVYVIEYYLFDGRKIDHPYRGAVLLITAAAFALVDYFFIFHHIVGRFGIAYFSPTSIVSSGGVGAEPLNALLQSSMAICYFHFAFLWMVYFWNVAFGPWPWDDCRRLVAAASKLITVLLLAIICYVILFHPPICHFFYPVQSKAGVSPWWADISGTSSGHFSVGLIWCTLGWLIISTLLWEGYPWEVLGKNGRFRLLIGFAAVVFNLVLGILTMVAFVKAMALVWGEPFPGGAFPDGIEYRYSHSAEISSFSIMTAFILKYYFNNFPNHFNIWIRSFARTLIALAGGGLLYLIYYSRLGSVFIGFDTGIGFPRDTPLILVMTFLTVILIQKEFFQVRPLERNM